LIDEIGELEHGASFYKLILEGITQRNQQDIPNISTWQEHETTSFSQPLARGFPEHQECLRTKVTGSLELKHKAPTQPDHVIDLERVYSADELRAHYRSYVDLLAKQKRIEDFLDVEKKHLKVAIGNAQSFQHLFSWSRREVTEVDPTAFRTKHPDLYKKCRVTTSTLKCEILPFRG
jgi:predicted phage-related endonuclease